MVKLKKRLSQQDFVGGLFHAFMVCYDETLKTHGEEHADEWLILHDVILSITFLVSGLEAGEPDAKLRDILDEFHGKVAVGMANNERESRPNLCASYRPRAQGSRTLQANGRQGPGHHLRRL